ncbi:spermatogenesis associated 6-like protein isoform X3 [Oryzias melastigma]|uniref:Spermatogenesis associated 6-like n=1 Tax=Oryzias melastigma TaxID=30732 RepID=A0A3B3BE75_ORYME|nr:spermatogenesis associated 6-like protein isoform X3 [Oryzias melastigma]
MIPGLQKAFKVRVEIKFRAVSCPGVKLPAKEDMYLSVFVTGQYHQSQCLPAVFPLLFQEKMTFEKIFRYAFDPGDVAVMLEHETIRIELIQLIPPAGHLLASFEENTRNFLFPEPKLVRPFSGVDREALMMRAPYFPGIAPRLEFSTRTSISQCLPDSEICIYPNVVMRPATHRKRSHSRRQRISSPERKHPPTHRGRRAGSADPQRLGAARPQSLSPLRRGTSSQRFSRDLAASCSSDWKTSTSQPVGQIPQEDCGSSQLFQSPDSDYNPDPSALFRPNRTTSESHRVWEEVHERVRGLLTTPKAVRRLIYGASVSEVDEVLARRSFSPDLQ